MGCLGSLLISTRLCGQPQRGNFYQGQSTKLWIPPSYPPLPPSDTKLLLANNYSKIIIFGKIMNLKRNSLKMSFFPGHFESTKYLKIITKKYFSGYFFVIISCQRVLRIPTLKQYEVFTSNSLVIAFHFSCEAPPAPCRSPSYHPGSPCFPGVQEGLAARYATPLGEKYDLHPPLAFSGSVRF